MFWYPSINGINFVVQIWCFVLSFFIIVEFLTFCYFKKTRAQLGLVLVFRTRRLMNYDFFSWFPFCPMAIIMRVLNVFGVEDVGSNLLLEFLLFVICFDVLDELKLNEAPLCYWVSKRWYCSSFLWQSMSLIRIVSSTILLLLACFEFLVHHFVY